MFQETLFRFPRNLESGCHRHYGPAPLCTGMDWNSCPCQESARNPLFQGLLSQKTGMLPFRSPLISSQAPWAWTSWHQRRVLRRCRIASKKRTTCGKRFWENWQLLVTRPSYETWLRGTVGLAYADGEFVVGAPNAFVAEMLDQRMYSLISLALGRAVDDAVDVRFTVLSAGPGGTGAIDFDGGTSKIARDTLGDPLPVRAGAPWWVGW